MLPPFCIAPFLTLDEVQWLSLTPSGSPAWSAWSSVHRAAGHRHGRHGRVFTEQRDQGDQGWRDTLPASTRSPHFFSPEADAAPCYGRSRTCNFRSSMRRFAKPHQLAPSTASRMVL